MDSFIIADLSHCSKRDELVLDLSSLWGVEGPLGGRAFSSRPLLYTSWTLARFGFAETAPVLHLCSLALREVGWVHSCGLLCRKSWTKKVQHTLRSPLNSL